MAIGVSGQVGNENQKIIYITRKISLESRCTSIDGWNPIWLEAEESDCEREFRMNQTFSRVFWHFSQSRETLFGAFNDNY